MEFNTVLQSRRSIRKFNQEEVSDELVRKIIEAGLLAPSAHFRQPWRFLILKEKDKEKVVDLIKDYAEESKTEDKSILRTAGLIEQGNVLILVFNASQENIKMDTLSIGACIENMLLESTNLGVSSLWIGNVIPVSQEIYQVFDISNLELMSGVLLGYFDGEVPNLTRKTYEDVVIR